MAGCVSWAAAPRILHPNNSREGVAPGGGHREGGYHKKEQLGVESEQELDFRKKQRKDHSERPILKGKGGWVQSWKNVLVGGSQLGRRKNAS